MKIRDLYERPDPVFSIEFFPPKTEKGDAVLFKEIAVLKDFGPAFCSVTYGAGGSTRHRTVDLVDQVRQEFGLEVMCHLTLIGQSKDEVRAVLAELKRRGIENIIALGGDPPRDAPDWKPHPDGFRHSIELVREAAAHQWFSIAVAGFPEVHPKAESREADLRYLKEKVDAGADVIITQLFFDNGDFYRYAEDVGRLGVKAPVVPGILPILSVPQVRRFTELCGSKIPRRLERMMGLVENDDEGAVKMGIDYATEQCEGLLRFGVRGIHFYSLNKSRSVMEIARNLGR
jgi:methylenetetrahydrofolate reductase (NADPH)